MSFIFLFLILLLIAGLLVGAGVGFYARQRGGAQVSEPQCARCGYGVRGLPTFTCPECGADLREVGIRTPNSTRPIPRFVWALLWTLTLPVPAILLTAVAAATILPARSTQTFRRTIFVQTPYLNQTLTLSAESSRLRFGAAGGTPSTFPPPIVSITAGNATFTYDSATNLGRLTSPGSAHSDPVPFDSAAVLSLLKAAGADATDSRVAARAADVVPIVNEMTQGKGSFSFIPAAPNAARDITAHPTSISVATAPVKWLWLAGLAFWLTVWAAGVFLILRRRSAGARPVTAFTPGAD